MPQLPPYLCGDAFAGTSEPAVGVAYDVNARPAAWDTVELSYDYEAANPTEHQVGLYLNGGLTQRLDSSISLASLANLQEGRHTVQLLPSRTEGTWPDRHGYYRGQRAYVVWDRSTDATTAAYRVYSSPDTLLATIDTITVQERTNVPIQGAGRCSSWGFYDLPDPINATLTVTFGATAGEYTWTLGALSGSGEFAAGETMLFPFGISVRFHDDPEDYPAAATFTVAIGPANEYLTGVQSPGIAEFLVSAVDAAGNESTPVAITPMQILDIPEPIEAILPISYSEPEIGIEWIDDSSGNDVYVYSNWNTVTQTFEDHVILENPHAIVAVSSSIWIFNHGSVEGTLKFYLRVTVPGEPLRQNESLTLYTFNFPPTPPDFGLILGEPGSLSATAIADGYIEFSWDYRPRVNDAVAEFAVVENIGSPTFDWDNPDVEVPYEDDADTPVSTYTVTRGPFLNGQVVYFSVRAVSATGVQSLNTAYVSATADTAAPTFAGPGYNVPQ